MVTPRPLKLKTQIGAPEKKNVASELPIARVWVDTGVFHLDTPFDYWVPEEFSEIAQVGVRVEVEFGSSRQEGIVIERIAGSPNSGKLKQILQILSPHSVATSETIELIRLVSRRWAGAPYDIIRSAIPPRLVSVDKEDFSAREDSQLLDEAPPLNARALTQEYVRLYWVLPASISRQKLLAALVAQRSKMGQVLLIVPDERELTTIEEELRSFVPESNMVRLDGHLTRSQRYRNFLKVATGQVDVALGLRGAVFTPLRANATIIVCGESSELLHEARTPGWNARDVALIRASEFKTNIILTGYSPSLEAARLIETKWLSSISSKVMREVVAIPQAMGELIPSGAFSIIRKALKIGPVLFLVPRKGYGNSVLCNKCRNVALCDCGGRLELTGAGENPRCVLCGREFKDWKCKWCQSGEIYLVARGIDRFAEEIGRAFPNLPVINSSGEHIVDEVASIPSLVISTPGAQPKNPEGYAAVALLEGLRFFGHSELRSTESSREIFFQSAAMARQTAPIFVAFTPMHPIVHALTRWDSTPLARKELAERQEMNFPPYFRFVCIDTETSEATRIHAGLLQAKDEGRIGLEVRIAGPHERKQGISRITLSAPVATAASLVDFVHELQRRRSISRKPLFAIRIDPYSLT